MNCPMCGGPQDRHILIQAVGGWDADGKWEIREKNIQVLRCVDCGYDEEIIDEQEKQQS